MKHKIMNLSDLMTPRENKEVKKQQRIFNLSAEYWLTIDDIEAKIEEGLYPFQHKNAHLTEIKNPFVYESGQNGKEFVNLKDAVWLTAGSKKKALALGKEFRVASIKMKRLAEFGKGLPNIKKYAKKKNKKRTA